MAGGIDFVAFEVFLYAFKKLFAVYLLCSRHCASHDGYKDKRTEVLQMVTFLMRSQLLPQSILASVTEGQEQALS